MRLDVRDDAGLIGKIIVAWLLFLALAVVAVIDTGSILITRFKAESATRAAASAGAEAFAATSDQGAARRAAEDAAVASGGDVTIVDFAVLDGGRVRVVAVADPDTIVAERIAPFAGDLGDMVEVRVRAMAEPSAG